MDNHGEMLIYQTEDGLTKIDVNMQDETVWLSQAEMTKLFQTTKQNISLHINNIFKDGELEKASVVKGKASGWDFNIIRRKSSDWKW